VDDPDDTTASDGEIDYLLEAMNTLLPGRHRAPAIMWYAFAGIRSLPYAPRDPEGAITRRHRVVDHADEGLPGLFSIVGGKLTTYRSLAAQVTARLFAALHKPDPGGRTAVEPLVPGTWSPAAADATERRLWQIYGAGAAAVLRVMRDNPDTAAPLCPHTSDTIAQAVHAVRHEGAVTIGDVLLRRTPAGWSRCLGLDAAPRVAQVLGEQYGWDAPQRQRACADYRGEVSRTFRTSTSAQHCFG
jgi:glycerol-3-phosphate dehydrogenase